MPDERSHKECPHFADRRLRVAVVTETYPPEVNGVAATISRVVAGLRQRGHDPALVRPRQGPADRASAEGGAAEMLVRGLSIPRYPELRMGLPCRRALMRHWAMRRPDVVHLVTEGPLGWSALQAAARLGLPVVSDLASQKGRVQLGARGHQLGVEVGVVDDDDASGRGTHGAHSTVAI